MAGVVEAILGAVDRSNASLLDGSFGQPIVARSEQIVFSEGDPADAVYLLLDGIVRCHVSVGREGPEERTTLLCRGPALLGDRDVLAGTEASESVRCLSAATLLTWSSETYLAAFGKSDELRELMTRDLASRYTRCLALAGLQLAPLHQSVAVLQRETESQSATWIAAALSVAPKSVTRAFAQLRELAPEDLEGLPEISLIHSIRR